MKTVNKEILPGVYVGRFEEEGAFTRYEVDYKADMMGLTGAQMIVVIGELLNLMNEFKPYPEHLVLRQRVEIHCRYCPCAEGIDYAACSGTCRVCPKCNSIG